MQKCTPTENFLRLARPNVFATGSNDAKANADRTIFRLAQPNHKYPPIELFSRLVRPKILTTGANDVKMKAIEIFLPGSTKAKKFADRIFLQLRWPKHERPPTKTFLRLSRQKFFDWRDRSKSFRRQKSICDWRDRSTIDSLPQFFCNWGDCSTNERRPKFFRDWRVRKLFRLARPT